MYEVSLKCEYLHREPNKSKLGKRDGKIATFINSLCLITTCSGRTLTAPQQTKITMKLNEKRKKKKKITLCDDKLLTR